MGGVAYDRQQPALGFESDDCDRDFRAVIDRGAVGLEVQARGDASEDLRDAGRAADWFEKECHVKVYSRQAPGIINRIRRLLRPSSSLESS